MKLVQAEKTFESNAQFTSEDFTIGDVSVVIEILRNKLYRHKVRTLVQEYISNARDAMREAGNTSDRVQVTVPTVFDPTFKVRDFGPGISPDRMYNVFIKYAASTKRDSNSQTGGFGIGAKSAWSYTESFSIVTYIDGVQRNYVAHIGANNNGRLDFLGETQTEEANGTEIQIPVSPKDVEDFRRAALRATFFWKESEKPDLVNMSADDTYEYVQGDMIGNVEVNHNLPGFIASTWDTGIVIVIDGIPYFASGGLIDKIVPLERLEKLVSGRLVMHLECGDLEVSASREEISDSKRTQDMLTEVARKALKAVEHKLQNEFAKATTPFEHLSVYMELKDSYKLDGFRQCGDFTVTDKNSIKSVLFNNVNMQRCQMESYTDKIEKGDMNKTGRRSWDRGAMLKPEWFDHLYFTDGSETALITNHRLREVLKDTNVVILFSKKDTDAGEFDKLKTGLGLKDLTKVAYTKPERKSRAAEKIERAKQEFCIHDMSRRQYNARYITLDGNTDKWLYTSRSDSSSSRLRELSDYAEQKGFKICALSKDAMKRVKGDSNFKSLDSWLKSLKPTKEEIKILKSSVAKNDARMEDIIKVPGIKDEFLSQMVEEYKSLQKVKGQSIPDGIKAAFGEISEVADFEKDDTELQNLLETKYPLLKHVEYWYANKSVLEEVAFYINAKN